MKSTYTQKYHRQVLRKPRELLKAAITYLSWGPRMWSLCSTRSGGGWIVASSFLSLGSQALPFSSSPVTSKAFSCSPKPTWPSLEKLSELWHELMESLSRRSSSRSWHWSSSLNWELPWLTLQEEPYLLLLVGLWEWEEDRWVRTCKLRTRTKVMDKSRNNDSFSGKNHK